VHCLAFIHQFTRNVRPIILKCTRCRKSEFLKIANLIDHVARKCTVRIVCIRFFRYSNRLFTIPSLKYRAVTCQAGYNWTWKSKKYHRKKFFRKILSRTTHSNPHPHCFQPFAHWVRAPQLVPRTTVSCNDKFTSELET